MDYDSHMPFRTMLNTLNSEIVKALGPHPHIRISDSHYKTEDGTDLPIKVYQPINPPKEGSPLIVMFHGGGFCMGKPESEEMACRNFVSAFGAVCVSGSYRLAPEFKFPQPIKDAWDCVKWTVANARSLGADPSLGFILGGTSAGGIATSCLAHVARDEKLSPPLTGQYLNVPAVVLHGKLPGKYAQYAFSYEQTRDAPVLSQGAVEMFVGTYAPDENDGIWFASFNHPDGHAGLPPAYFQLNGLDPVRDEALVYERVLNVEYGIETRLDVYPGLPHDHSRFFPTLSSSEKFHKDQTEGMGWLLKKKPDWTDVKTKVVL